VARGVSIIDLFAPTCTPNMTKPSDQNLLLPHSALGRDRRATAAPQRAAEYASQDEGRGEAAQRHFGLA
jgi:hypothetical protein